MILVVDNYDSFTWNLVHLIGGLGHRVEVRRNDAQTAAEILAGDWRAIVLSPGPGTPDDAGVCLDLVTAAVAARRPLFGVCLGLQATAQALGGRVVRAARLMHGKTSTVAHDGDGLFNGIAQGFVATRYHSLVAERESLPDSLAIAATAEDDGEIMALAHRTAPVAGVQFHPESVASQAGAEIFANFLDWADGRAT